EAYVVGTGLDDFPVSPGAFQTKPQGGQQGFAARLDAQGARLLYATFLAYSHPNAITLDSAGNAYIAGGVQFGVFPTTPGALQSVIQGGDDVFVLKLKPDASSLVFSTLLGGSGGDRAYGVAVDSSGAVYV